jgi:hypothetical protein
MEITLTPDIERALAKQARRQDTTPKMLALDALRERFASSMETETPTGKQKTLADFLAGHIGVLSSSEHIPGGARMSENCGKKFAAHLIKKRQKERL